MDLVASFPPPLDEARSDPQNPTNLNGVLDAETGEQLVWQGKPLDDDP